MLDLMIYILAFMFAIGILVTVHELGHFLVARLFKVKVIRFSIGFGIPLWRKKDKHETEYTISMIPLGGYVKMLGEKAENITEKDKNFAFSYKPVWQRILIVIAGPLANFLFAILAFSLLFIIGIKGILPIVGAVTPNSIAATAGINKGDRVIAIDDVKVDSWQEVLGKLLNNSQLKNTTKEIIFSDQEVNKNKKITVNLDKFSGKEIYNGLKNIGIYTQLEAAPAIIEQIEEDSAASNAGLLSGDIVTAINDKELISWQDLIETVRQNPRKQLIFKVLRGDKYLNIAIKPITTGSRENKIGSIGVRLKAPTISEDEIIVKKYNLFDSTTKAITQTVFISIDTINMLGRMLIGQLDFSNLGGPISIAKGAGQSAKSGIEYYLYFLALISISLGVINLLPIPLLDGGHLLYYSMEVLLRRPLSEKTQQVGAVIGFFILLSIMGIAFYNDLLGL